MPRNLGDRVIAPFLWLQAGISAITMFGLAALFFVAAAVGIVLIVLYIAGVLT